MSSSDLFSDHPADVRTSQRGISPSDELWFQRLCSEWSGRRVAVWGAARSGVAAANLLTRLGAQVVLSDPKSDLCIQRDQIDPRVELLLGQPNTLAGAKLLIPSPALRPSHSLIQEVRAKGVQLMSEIELGARCTQARLVGITGTDGKSTTTSLITHLLTRMGVRAQAVGNIGDPLCNWALDASPEMVLIVEVSAFQLWSTHFFPAEVAVLTNIAKDHYDYFDGDGHRYSQSKLRLASLMRSDGTFLWPDGELAGSDAVLFDLVDELKTRKALGDELKTQSVLANKTCPQVQRFGLDPSSQWGAYQGSYWRERGGEREGEREEIAPMTLSPLIGRHNHRNVIAAFATLSSLGFPLDQALQGLSSFQGLSYRMELIRTIDNVRWVNDSKATNINASRAGLESVDDPLIVIMGGYDKGLDHSPLIPLLKRQARHLCLIGQTGQLLYEELKQESNESLFEVTWCEHLKTAVDHAHQLSRSGDLVILSPATSSFDQFQSFEHRGAKFTQYVKELK